MAGEESGSSSLRWQFEVAVAGAVCGGSLQDEFMATECVVYDSLVLA